MGARIEPAHDGHEIGERNITKRLATHTAVKHRDQVLHLKLPRWADLIWVSQTYLAFFT